MASNAPPPVPNRRNSQGLLHGLKRRMFNSNESTQDENFDEYRTIFTKYVDTLNKTAEDIRRLSERSSLYTSGLNEFWDTMNRQFDESSHAYTPVVARGKHAHDTFSVRSHGASKVQLNDALDAVLDIIKECTNLKRNIDYRDEALREYDYYNGKVGELLKDKEKTLQNGKQVKPKDQEKLDRNQDKLREKKAEYMRVNEELSHALYNFLVVRFDKLAPIINLVISAEKKIAGGLQESLDAIPSEQTVSLKTFVGEAKSVVESPINPFAPNL